MPIKKLQNIAIFSIVAVCTVFLFVGVSFRHNQELKELWNIGHFLLFLFIAHPSTIRNKLNQYPLIQRIIIISAISLLLAGSIEYIQLFLNRSVSLIDIYISIMGGVTSVFLFTNITKKLRLTGIILSTLAGTITFIYAAGLYLGSKINYPIKMGISKNNEASYVSGKAWRTYNKETEEIQVTFNTDVYSTIRFTNIKTDWRNYTYLKIHLTNLNDHPFRLHFRINDLSHIKNGSKFKDRFLNRIHIDPGAQTITIKLNEVENAPLNRKMDMSNIHELQIFTKYAGQNFKIILHSLVLE